MAMQTIKLYDEPVVKFGVISDVHIGYYTEGCNEDLIRAMTAFRNRKIGLVSCCGDLVIHNNIRDQEIQEFKSIMSRFPEIVYKSCNGNHDSPFTDSEWRQYLGTEKCHTYVCGKFAFIWLSMSIYSDQTKPVYPIRDNPYTEYLPWLQQKLNEFKDKFVFLFLHFPIPNSSVSEGVPGLKPNWYYGFSSSSSEPATILNMLRTHKNVAVFSGHTHYAHNVQNDYPNVIFYREPEYNLTFIHTPSLTAPRNKDQVFINRTHPELQPSGGYAVYAYEDRIRIAGLEFNTDNEVRFGKENLHYQKNIEIKI